MESVETDYSSSLIYNFLPSGWSNDIPPPLTESDGDLKKDLWSFGYFWWEIIDHFSHVEQLYRALQDLQEKSGRVRDQFEPLTEDYSSYRVVPNEEMGISGSYLLLNDEEVPCYIIKPLDEDGGCIHSEETASPFVMSPFRGSIPLYQSSLREVLAYLVAEEIGVHSIVPKTDLGIIESELFHDLSQGVSLEELERYQEHMGPVDKRKLCSVQKYILEGKSLFEAIHEFEMADLSDHEILERFDQDSFEDANILLWITYDTDGHMGNFLVYPKEIDGIGNEILGLIKIDNGLAFPETNLTFRNNLAYLPNADKVLTERAKAKIAKIDVQALSELFQKMGLESAIDAMKERIFLLQNISQKDGITIREINSKISKIGRKR